MSGLSLRLLITLLAAMGLAACEKKEAGSVNYGRQDAECFAGIIREADARHMSQADFRKWEDKLGDKDKIWIVNFTGYQAYLTKQVVSHLGKTTDELVEAKVLTKQEKTVVDAYVKLAQDGDAERARNIAARACSSISFSKGLDLN